MNFAKTTFLLALMTVLFMFVGRLAGGVQGMQVAFVFAVVMNFFSYFFSDKLVLLSYRAKPAKEAEYPQLYAIVRRLTQKANLPMPRVYIIPTPTPNAFATGRNPNHAVVACTEGILKLLTDR